MMSDDHTTNRKSSPDQAADVLDFARRIARIATDNRAENVVILDLRGLSSLTDFFVIGTGTSSRQMHAVVDDVHDYAKEIGRRPFRTADTKDTTWVLADYVDVVLHLFDEEHRNYYDLEGLWGDAPRIEWNHNPE